MYEELQISVLEKGGYTVVPVQRELGRFNPFVAAFSTKAELLIWLDLNLTTRSPDFINCQQAPLTTAKTDDEIPF